MQFLKEWAIGLIVVSAISSIIFLLSPSGKFDKQVKTAVSIVLLAVTVYPFFNVKLSDIDVSEDITSFEGNNIQQTENGALNNFRDVLIENVSETLRNSGYEPTEIVCEAEINEENELKVNNITVYINEADSENISSIVNLIRNEYGIVAQIEVSNE